MHVLQVCNVGSIVGGTAACAWSLTRAWPWMQHTVAFLSSVDTTTRAVFQPHHVLTWPQCTSHRIAELQPDLVILHNVARTDASLWKGAFSIQYVHSVGPRINADLTVHCSRWLAYQCRAPMDSVLWQGVPVPPLPVSPRERDPGRLRIGRICTPSSRKWPESLPGFYSGLATEHPQVDWEFVGCPAAMQPLLNSACRGQARFFSAGWQARSHLWEWDALLYHHPSLTESFGRTLAEAARAGCIPILDRRGGFIEQLDVIPGIGCRDIREFSQAIAQVSEPSTREELSRNVQTQSNAVFSLTAFAQRMNALVTQMDHDQNPSSDK